MVISPGPRYKSDANYIEFKLERWPSERPTKLRDFWFITKLIRKYKPSLMITNFAATNLCILAGWLLKVPHRIAYYHTSGVYSYLWKVSKLTHFYKKHRKGFIYHLCTQIFTVSNATKEELLLNHKLNEEKVFVFHNSLLDPHLGNKEMTERKTELICVGRMEAVKGHDLLIKALSYVKDAIPHIKVKFVGSGDLEEPLKKMASDLNLDSNIEFLGNIPHDQVLWEIADSKILVLPSRFEGLPYVIIEALSVGTPVIAANVGGIPEIFEDGNEGILVPAEDINSLAASISQLLTNQDCLTSMSKLARKRFENNFLMEKLIKTQTGFLGKLLKKSTNKI